MIVRCRACWDGPDGTREGLRLQTNQRRRTALVRCLGGWWTKNRVGM